MISKNEEMKTSILNISKYLFPTVSFVEPLIEAVINSIQAGANDITIEFHRDENNEIHSVTIEDDGLGFSQDDIKSFNVLAGSSDNKKKLFKCKGIGRLSYLRIFNSVELFSVSKNLNGEYSELNFTFDSNFDETGNFKSSNAKKTGTKLKFNLVRRDELKKSCLNLLKEPDDNKILNLLINGNHEKVFSSVMYSVLSSKKKIKINNIEINCSNIQYQSQEITMDKIRSESLKDKTIRVEWAFHNFDNEELNSKNYISYKVGDRAVEKVFKTDYPYNFIGDFEGKSLICTVSSNLIENNTANNWQGFELNNNELGDFKHFVRESIYEQIIKQHLQSNPAIDSKEKTIKENPNLKMILNEFDDVDFLDSKNVIKKAVQKKQDILQQFYKSDAPNLEKNHNLDIIQSSSLAELMVCRFAVLKEMQTVCQTQTSSEDDVHNKIIAMRSINKDNNLWLFDARWQYSNLIASDTTINKTLREYFKLEQYNNIEEAMNSKGLKISDEIKPHINKEPDVAIFNDDSIVIVEFKKPGVDTTQFITKTALYAKLFALSIPQYKRFFIYLIGRDLDARPEGFRLTVDGRGAFNPNEKLTFETKNEDGVLSSRELGDIYYEVCTYNKFLKDCYMQHRPFFQKIGKEIDVFERYIPKQFNS